MREELIQIVDDNDEPLRGASIQDAHKNGWRHRVVHALVWDQAGRVLLQRRHDKLKLYPGRWGTSAAGYMFEHEQYDMAVARKLADELGLANVPLKDIGTYSSEETVEGVELKRINKVFETEVQSDVELRLDPESIAEIQWLDVVDIKHMIEERPDSVTPGLIGIAQRYL